MRRIIRVLPHLTIILALMFVTFWILDIYNPMMNFVNSSISNVLLLIFCILSIMTSIISIALDRKPDKK